MTTLKDWIIGGRFFVAPIVLLFTLFGATLGGFNLSGWLLSFGIVISINLAAHYMNDWRDYARGVDTLQEGGSVSKSYTAAAVLIPEGRMTVRVAKASAAGFLALGCLLLFLAPVRWDVFAIFILGVVVALTYTDLWKPLGLVEPAVGLGSGFASTTFSCAVVGGLSMGGVAGGILLGMLAALLTTLDQWTDIKSVDRVRSLAELVFASKMKVSGYWWFAVTSILVMQLSFVIIGWIPRGSLTTIFSLPLAHIAGMYLDYDFDIGMRIMIGWICLFAGLGSLGVALL